MCESIIETHGPPWILFQNWNPMETHDTLCPHGPPEFYSKIASISVNLDGTHGPMDPLNFTSKFMGNWPSWILIQISWGPLEFIPKFVIEFFIGTPKWYQTAKRAVSLFLDVMTELEPVRSLSYIKDAGSSCMNGPRLPDFAKVNAAPKESSMSRKIHLRT